MLIRPATPGDRPAIIDLLRKSLGESSIPKSEALWLWKHEQNPFGASFVLVAEEDNQLIGVRAFMQWEWVRNGKIYRAVRAVDTATHPDHQGKGIFKKLTLQQVEICRQQGILFVFNTPNHKSRPGYLKMGWIVQGKMPLKFKLLRPFSIARSRLFNRQKQEAQEEDPSPVQKWTQDIMNVPYDYVQHEGQLATVLSPQYLSWRYANNPLYRYNYFSDREQFLLISRIKQHAFGKELRLVDFIQFDPRADERSLGKAIKKMVLPYCKQHKIDLISFSGYQYRASRRCFGWMGWLPVRSSGPVITLRDLNMHENFKYLLNSRNWCYAIGDLELF